MKSKITGMYFDQPGSFHVSTHVIYQQKSEGNDALSGM